MSNGIMKTSRGELQELLDAIQEKMWRRTALRDEKVRPFYLYRCLAIYEVFCVDIPSLASEGFGLNRTLGIATIDRFT